MGRKRFSPEQIIIKLREAEIIESKGLAQLTGYRGGMESWFLSCKRIVGRGADCGECRGT